MPRLIFVNRYFFPDHSATSQILSDLAFHLAGGRREVHVVASRQNYDSHEAALPSEAIVNDMHVHRVASTHMPHKQASLEVPADVRRGDAVAFWIRCAGNGRSWRAYSSYAKERA